MTKKISKEKERKAKSKERKKKRKNTTMCHGQCCESECEDLQTKTDTTVYNKK
jgi:hypothetical protein